MHKHAIRAHVSLHQAPSGLVRAVYWHDGEPAPTSMPPVLPADVVHWLSTRKAMVDCLMTGITSCEEYCPF